jgi:hypothetical protein
MEGKHEYTPESGHLQRASEALDRVEAERIDRLGKIGSDEVDVLVAAQSAMARASLAVAYELKDIRQGMTTLSGQMSELSERVKELVGKFPALG